MPPNPLKRPCKPGIRLTSQTPAHPLIKVVLTGLGVLLVQACSTPMFARSETAPTVSAGDCFDLRVGNWSGAHLGPDTMALGLPQRVKLLPEGEDPSPFGAADRHGLVASVAGATPNPFGYAAWGAAEDSLTLYWGNFSSAVVARMQWGEDRYLGEVSSHWDYLSPSQEATVEAVPGRCDAPADPAWGRYRRLPTVVHLSSGDSLVLDRRVPARLAVDTLNEPASGVFAGAAAIAPQLRRDGTLRAVFLFYPADADFQDLIAGLSTEWGGPSGRSSVPEQEIVMWSGRASRMTATHRIDGTRRYPISVRLEGNSSILREP